jgi:hypothetical protein
MSANGSGNFVAAADAASKEAQPKPAARTARRRAALVVAVGVVAPLAISVAWIPIRTKLPNVDLALVLIVAVAAVGALGHRIGVAVAAVSAALWFEFFDTVPFERLGIARSPDVETTLILAVVAVMVGELAVRTTRHRSFVRSENENLSSIRSAAELVASGEELVGVIEAVVGDLTHLLALRACTFESTDPDPGRAQLSREGELELSSRPMALTAATRPGVVAELPVIVQGEAIGHFVLEFDPQEPPARERLLVALTLADNVGAAFLAQAPPPLPPDKQPALRLKLLGPDGGRSPAGKVGGGQENAGFTLEAGVSSS